MKTWWWWWWWWQRWLQHQGRASNTKQERRWREGGLMRRSGVMREGWEWMTRKQFSPPPPSSLTLLRSAAKFSSFLRTLSPLPHLPHDFSLVHVFYYIFYDLLQRIIHQSIDSIDSFSNQPASQRVVVGLGVVGGVVGGGWWVVGGGWVVGAGVWKRMGEHCSASLTCRWRWG